MAARRLKNILVRLESYDSGGSISEAFTDRLGKV